MKIHHLVLSLAMLLVAICGCDTAHSRNIPNVREGMAYDEVVAEIGSPSSISRDSRGTKDAMWFWFAKAKVHVRFIGNKARLRLLGDG